MRMDYDRIISLIGIIVILLISHSIMCQRILIPSITIPRELIIPTKIKNLKQVKVILKNQHLCFREPGNVIYSSKFGVYILAYSAHKGAYDGYNVFVGIAISKDLEKWEDLGEIIPHAEDPYLVEYNNTLYLFAEYKRPGNIHAGIGLWTAHSLENWSFVSLILESKIRKGRVIYDVSSPLIWYDENGWHMLYEVRKNTRHFYGQIYLKNGTSPTDWEKRSLLILGRNKSDDVVPDDICFIKDRPILLLHRYEGRKWVCRLAVYLNYHKAIEIEKDLPMNLMFFPTNKKSEGSKLLFLGIGNNKHTIAIYEAET